MQLRAILGKKQNQRQTFLENGTRIPVSVIDVSGNVISQIKTKDKEGYNAVQIAFGIKKDLNKPLKGHVKKAGIEKTPAFFREVRVDDLVDLASGAQINVADVFAPGDIVDVSGVSKGKGFAGGVKRHHFQGGPRTHGQSDRERAPGSLGQTTTPGRVYKGKRMAGRMGHENVTVKNLEIIEITDDGLILVKGLVPGGVNSWVLIKKVGENKKFVPLYKEEVATQDASRQSASADVQESVDVQKSDTLSLSDRSAPVVEEKVEASQEPAVDSAESEQAPSAQGEVEIKEKEQQEVKEDAK